MKALLRTLIFALVFAGLGLAAARATVRVPAQAVGVRASKWGGGVETRDYTCGLYRSAPGLDQWYMLEAGFQTLTFGGEVQDGTAGRRLALEIRTQDNNTVKIDATVTYRIRRGEAHRIVLDGLQTEYRLRAALTVEDILRSELQNLSSEDWFDTDLRRAEIARIQPRIAEAFRVLHLELGDILIHSSSFPASFETKLQEKQILAQLALLESAKSALEDAKGVAELISAQTESEIKRTVADADKRLQEVRSATGLEITTILARAERYQRETKAQANLTYDRLVAEGKLELDRAAAEGERLALEALASEGGRMYLASEAATKLKIDHVELDATDPRVPLLLDLDQLTSLLIGGTR